MISLKPVNGSTFTYSHIVGTGGIGSGMFFLLKDDHTLGRNESRMATLLPCKDFCKQHIILHYLAVLLGAKTGNFNLYSLGKVGNDSIGKGLVDMMHNVGINTNYIGTSANSSTLFSVCYQYPDNSGGNITTENSASGELSPDDIHEFFRTATPEGGKEIILAVPEVPVKTRIELLKYGRQRHSLNIASVLVSEVDEFKALGGFEMVNMLSINIDEAKSIANITTEAAETKTILDACIKYLVNINPDITVLITAGSRGCYCYHENYLEFAPAPAVQVSSTAGAGDAFLAGVIAGMCCGLPLTKGTIDKSFSETPIKSAVELGTLLASLSVTSQDTIHPTADTETVYSFAQQLDVRFDENFREIFKNCTGL